MPWQDTINKILSGGFDDAAKKEKPKDDPASKPQDSVGSNPETLLAAKDKQIATLMQQVAQLTQSIQHQQQQQHDSSIPKEKKNPYIMPQMEDDEWEQLAQNPKLMFQKFTEMLLNIKKVEAEDLDNRFNDFEKTVNTQYGGLELKDLRRRHPEFNDFLPEINALVQSGKGTGMTGEEMLTFVKALNPEKAKKVSEKYPAGGTTSNFGFGAQPNTQVPEDTYEVSEYDPEKPLNDQLVEELQNYVKWSNYSSLSDALDDDGVTH